MSDDGRLIRDDFVRLIGEQLERENALWRMMRDAETPEARAERERWNRSLRGRWFSFKYWLREITAPVRYRIARRIYWFREDDD